MTALTNRLSLWGYWVLASAASMPMVLLMMYAGIALVKLFDPGVNEDRLFGILMFPIFALALSLLQWLVLVRMLRVTPAWLFASLAGWAVTLGLAFLLAAPLARLLGFESMPSWVGRFVLALAGAFLLGMAQWLYFRARYGRAWLWIPATMLGWVLALALIGETITDLGEVTLLGALPAGFTGFVLVAFHGDSR